MTLQPAWYIPADIDFVRETAQRPMPVKLPNQLHVLLADNSLPHSSDRMLHALRIAIAALNHVHDAVEHPASTLPEIEDLQQLLHGLNLVAAHLAQFLPHLANKFDDDTISDEVARVMLSASARFAKSIAGQLLTADAMITASGKPDQTVELETLA